MTEAECEILRIAQEEMAECIQAISKVFRFGIDTEWKGIVNRAHLTEECGDVLAMIHLMVDFGIIDIAGLEEARENKTAKLKKWSHVFGEPNEYSQ